MTWKDYFKSFETYSLNLRGVAGPYPFSENVENDCIMSICIQDTLSSRAALGLPAECVARAKVSCIQHVYFGIKSTLTRHVTEKSAVRVHLLVNIMHIV